MNDYINALKDLEKAVNRVVESIELKRKATQESVTMHNNLLDGLSKYAPELKYNKIRPIDDHDCHASSEDGCMCEERE
jgi:hypothetical protein